MSTDYTWPSMYAADEMACMSKTGVYLDFLTRGGWSQCQEVADQTSFANCIVPIATPSLQASRAYVIIVSVNMHANSRLYRNIKAVDEEALNC